MNSRLDCALTNDWTGHSLKNGVSNLLDSGRRELLTRGVAALTAVVLSQAAEMSVSADAFVNSVGVVTHLGYTDSIYAKDFPLTLQSLKDLHVRHIRDGIGPGGNTPAVVAYHKQLTSAGIFADILVDQHCDPTLVKTFLGQITDVESLEAENEQDDANDPNWVTHVHSQLEWLKPMAESLKLPLVGPSFINSAWDTPQNSFLLVGNLRRYMTYNNLHNYFAGFHPETGGWGSSNAKGHGYGSIAWNLDQAELDGPSIPVWTTEAGYDVNTAHSNSVPPAVYGTYVARMLLAQWNAGIKRTFIYELADDPSTLAWAGLMDSSGKRRPAFLALASLLNLLQDPGTAFTPTPVAYSLSGNTANVQHTLLQKRDGSLYLAVWIAVPVYDTNAKVALSVPPQTVTLSLPSGIRSASLYTYDADWNLLPKTLSISSATLSVNATSNVAIVKLTPAL